MWNGKTSWMTRRVAQALTRSSTAGDRAVQFYDQNFFDREETAYHLETLGKLACLVVL